MTIVSFKHKFIFIKSGKVGGTSVQMALFPHLGEQDIVTSIFPAERNYQHRNIKYKETTFTSHMSAEAISTALGPNIFNTFFVFTIERNFQDKVISYYAMEKLRESQRNNRNLKFDEFINRKNFPQDLNKYSIRRENKLFPGVDKCYAYNNLWLLEKDFKKFFDIDLNLKNYNSKNQYRNNKMFVEPVFSSYQKDIVRKYYYMNKIFLKSFWLDSKY